MVKKSKTVAYGSSVSYGSGSYDSTAHGGYGKNQTGLGPSAGTDKGPTPHANDSPVKDGVSVTRKGQGGGYQCDSHSETHHGTNSQAVGDKSDNRPFNWNTPLHGEGEGGKLGHVEYNTGGGLHGKPSGKAEHLPAMGGEAYTFRKPSMGDAHAFSYAPEQKVGVLRMSGHKGSHRIGLRGKNHHGG